MSQAKLFNQRLARVLRPGSGVVASCRELHSLTELLVSSKSSFANSIGNVQGVALLKYFTTSSNPDIVRRWVGLLLHRTCLASPTTVNLIGDAANSAPHILVALGNTILGKEEDLKIVAGMIIKCFIHNGIDAARCGHIQVTGVQFPLGESQNWTSEFQQYLDHLHITRGGPANDFEISYLIHCEVDGVLRLNNSTTELLVIVQNRLTVILPSHADQVRCVDIPFPNLKALSRRQPQSIPNVTDELVLTLAPKTDDWTYLLDAETRTEDEIHLFFGSKDDATAAFQAIRERSMLLDGNAAAAHRRRSDSAASDGAERSSRSTSGVWSTVPLDVSKPQARVSKVTSDMVTNEVSRTPERHRSSSIKPDIKGPSTNPASNQNSKPRPDSFTPRPRSLSQQSAAREPETEPEPPEARLMNQSMSSGNRQPSHMGKTIKDNPSRESSADPLQNIAPQADVHQLSTASAHTPQRSTDNIANDKTIPSKSSTGKLKARLRRDDGKLSIQPIPTIPKATSAKKTTTKPRGRPKKNQAKQDESVGKKSQDKRHGRAPAPSKSTNKSRDSGENEQKEADIITQRHERREHNLEPEPTNIAQAKPEVDPPASEYEAPQGATARTTKRHMTRAAAGTRTKSPVKDKLESREPYLDMVTTPNNAIIISDGGFSTSPLSSLMSTPDPVPAKGLVDEGIARKPMLVSFAPEGPRNQGVTPLQHRSIAFTPRGRPPAMKPKEQEAFNRLFGGLDDQMQPPEPEPKESGLVIRKRRAVFEPHLESSKRRAVGIDDQIMSDPLKEQYSGPRDVSHEEQSLAEDPAPKTIDEMPRPSAGPSRRSSARVSFHGSPMPEDIPQRRESGRLEILQAEAAEGGDEVDPAMVIDTMSSVSGGNELRSVDEEPGYLITVLSSNSKKAPESPFAESTAISGHADEGALHREQLAVSPSHPTRNPFTMQPRRSPGTPFARRMQGQVTAPAHPVKILSILTQPVVEAAPAGSIVEPSNAIQVEEAPEDAYSDPSSTSDSEASSLPYTQEQAEGMEWEASLQPHQRSLADLLAHISNRLIRHLIHSETAIADVLADYDRAGAAIVAQLEDRRVHECARTQPELLHAARDAGRQYAQLQARLEAQAREARAGVSPEAWDAHRAAARGHVRQLEVMLEAVS